MSRTRERVATVSWLVLASVAWASGGPVDPPQSSEPRVAVATSKAPMGLVSSEGKFEPFVRVKEGQTLYSRDLLVALPGFEVPIVPTSKSVELLLWGNLPDLSSSPVLESAVVLHDTSVFDLDVTLVRGRIKLTNTKKEGAAKVWLRAPKGGVQLILREPGDSMAMEIYGRWPAGVDFTLTPKDAESGPVVLWEAIVLKGNLDIKAGKIEWAMSAHPGRAFFHGNTVDGPAREGPQKIAEIPDWAKPADPKTLKEKLVTAVITSYRDQLKTESASEAARTLLQLAAKDPNKARASKLRQMLVYAMTALDAVEEVAEVLNSSKDPEVRHAAVVGLRHWIGANAGRDRILYETLMDVLQFTRAEAATVLHLLHSPFAHNATETYETLIAYLGHRRPAVRELAHWHLVRLSGLGKDIAFDASGTDAQRDKAIAAWKKLIPAGTLPGAKKEETKK